MWKQTKTIDAQQKIGLTVSAFRYTSNIDRMVNLLLSRFEILLLNLRRRYRILVFYLTLLWLTKSAKYAILAITNDNTQTCYDQVFSERARDFSIILLQYVIVWDVRHTSGELQCVKSTAARIITRASWHIHIAAVLYNLSWLLIKARPDYMVLVLPFEAIQERLPGFTSDMLEISVPTRALRSQHSVALLNSTL